MRIAVVGSGVIGAYLVARLVKYGYDVDCYDVSYTSNLNEIEAEKTINVNGAYYGASKGRFFGKGGTSLKWGGQLSFLEKAQNNIHKDLTNIIARNKHKVLEFFNIKKFSDHPRLINSYWLNPLNRSLLRSLEGCNLIMGDVHKVVKTGGQWTVVFNNDQESKLYTKVYLCAGVFESARILMRSSLLRDSNLLFKDHVSLPLISVSNSVPNLLGEKVSAYISNKGLITQRLRIKDLGALSIVINEGSLFFAYLKKLLFSVKVSQKKKYSLISEFRFLIVFFLEAVVYRRLYIDRREWRVILDIEKQEFASFNVERGEINWRIDSKTLEIARDLQQQVINYYRKDSTKIEVHTLEEKKMVDTYHPFALVNSNCEMIVPITGKMEQGLFCFTTGMLPFISYTNPTASVLCLIENHLNSHD